jgi:protein OS-9
VIFSKSLISDQVASAIVQQAASATHNPPQASNTELESHSNANEPTGKDVADHLFDPANETYELMYLNGEQHLCTIPIVNIPPRNETSEAEAKLAEAKEMVRATNRGWELLQDLEGNCLYYVSGWWSYAFCYNSEITQFHALPPQAGKPPLPPARDTNTKEFVLGRAKKSNAKSDKSDEWGNAISTKSTRSESPKTDLQMKGDTRYLVQKMEGGTTCDLTGKPRKVEVQFHCNPQVSDRIGYIKEVTTCSYLMVIYTPRLCNDVAFMPPKDVKANPIVCRTVVPASEIEARTEGISHEAELTTTPKKEKRTITVGGVVLGGGKWITKGSPKMAIPANFNSDTFGKHIEIIGKARSKAEGGQVEMASDAALQELDLDPDMVEQVRKQVEQLAKEKGWKIEVVDSPGETREILGIVDGDEDDEKAPNKDNDESSEGSEEVFKEEL